MQLYMQMLTRHIMELKNTSWFLFKLMYSTCWTWSSTLHAPMALGQARQWSMGGEICTPRDAKVACRAHTLDPTTPEQNKLILFLHPEDADSP